MSASSRGVDPKAQCQNLLMRFRVIELKELLRSIGQSTKGRKPELMQRSADLLRHGSPKIQVKIQEIWERSHNSKKTDNYHKMAQRQFPFKGHRGQYVIHPDVTFKAHPFYVKFDTIIRPTALVSTNITSVGSYSMRLEFHLSPHQVQRVYSSRTAQGEYNTQVVMRFCRYEISCEQEDFLPKGCGVKINGQYLQMPSHIHNQPEQPRRCRPLDITHYIKTTPAHTNDVTVMWHQDILHPQGFVTTIELADILSSSDLLTKLKGKGIRSADYTRALVKEKLSIDQDSEISATCLKVSLICPLGKLRITNPCRAVNCQHLQCFDASIYLQMNERKARWVCPVCDKPAPFEDLVIDGLFKEICESSPHNDIEFSADGSWHPFSKKTGSTYYLSTPENKASRYSPVMIRDTPDEVERDGVGGASGRGQTGPIMIDLTLSSSDEEDEPPARRSSIRRQSSSSTSSASSSEERDDVITTLNTSGHVSPAYSPTPTLVNLSETPPTPVGRGSNAVARGNSVSSSGNNVSDLILSNSGSGLSQYSLTSLPLNFSLSNFTSNPTTAPISLNTALSANSAYQVLTSGPQSSNSSNLSLLSAASKPPSSASIPSSSCSSGQPVPVITSHVLPMPPYQQLNPSSTSELNPDFSFLFNL